MSDFLIVLAAASVGLFLGATATVAYRAYHRMRAAVSVFGLMRPSRRRDDR